jgi:hypothetical protein
MIGLSFDKKGAIHMHVKGGHYVIMKEGGKYYPIPIGGGGGKRQRDESTTSPIATMADLHGLPGVQPHIKGYEQLLQDFGKQTDFALDEPE